MPGTPDLPHTISSDPSASTSALPSLGISMTPLPTPLLSSSPLESLLLANRHRHRVASKVSQGPFADVHNTMVEYSQAQLHGDSVLALDDEVDNPSTPPLWPGILLSHGHLSSLGQSQHNPSFQALRFEASSGLSLSAKGHSGTVKVL